MYVHIFKHRYIKHIHILKVGLLPTHELLHTSRKSLLPNCSVFLQKLYYESILRYEQFLTKKKKKKRLACQQSLLFFIIKLEKEECSTGWSIWLACINPRANTITALWCVWPYAAPPTQNYCTRTLQGPPNN